MPAFWHRGNSLDVLLGAAMLALAVAAAVLSTAGLTVPPDPDLFRDAAQARAISDGAWSADQFFAGERVWYNPLVPGLVALIHKVTGAPVLLAYARSGVVLNLLGPVAFFVLVAALLNTGVAAAALFALLFLPPAGLPGFAAATYSPWLFAGVFSQALFYLGVLGLDRVRDSRELTPWLLCGVILGLTFLGHAAPALMLGTMVVVMAERLIVVDGRPGAARTALGAALCLATAFVISMPLTSSVLFHYKLTVLNAAPAAYEYGATDVANWRELLGRFAGGTSIAALAGLALLLADPDARARTKVIWIWMLVNAAVLALHYALPLWTRLGGSDALPLPAFHFFLYVEALRALFFGYAVWRAAEWIAVRAVRFSPRSFPLRFDRVVLAVALVAGTVVMWPALRTRRDFAEMPAHAASFTNADWTLARDWIETKSAPGTVFAAPDALGLYVIGPAGGRVVSVATAWANPYVPVQHRAEDQKLLMEALARGDEPAFCTLAHRYQVRYVVLPAQTDEGADSPHPSFLLPAYSTQNIRIWSVTGCSGA
jgi:hypothetical protein